MKTEADLLKKVHTMAQNPDTDPRDIVEVVRQYDRSQQPTYQEPVTPSVTQLSVTSWPYLLAESMGNGNGLTLTPEDVTKPLPQRFWQNPSDPEALSVLIEVLADGDVRFSAVSYDASFNTVVQETGDEPYVDVFGYVTQDNFQQFLRGYIQLAVTAEERLQAASDREVAHTLSRDALAAVTGDRDMLKQELETQRAINYALEARIAELQGQFSTSDDAQEDMGS